MAVQTTLEPIVERLQRSANVRTVYGEPVERSSRTVIPVARVAYGFGGGGDDGPGGETDGEHEAEGQARPSGFGGGGGVSATPAGALEITDTTTRFVRFGEPRRAIVASAVGFLLGVLYGRRQ